MWGLAVRATRVICALRRSVTDRSECDEVLPGGHNLEETGVSCRLGSDRMSAILTSKSQIVGIPPFPDRMGNAERNEAYPFSTTTSRKRMYLPIGAEPDTDHSDTRNANRWKMAVSGLHGKHGIRRSAPARITRSRSLIRQPDVARRYRRRTTRSGHGTSVFVICRAVTGVWICRDGFGHPPVALSTR